MLRLYPDGDLRDVAREDLEVLRQDGLRLSPTATGKVSAVVGGPRTLAVRQAERLFRLTLQAWWG